MAFHPEPGEKVIVSRSYCNRDLTATFSFWELGKHLFHMPALMGSFTVTDRRVVFTPFTPWPFKWLSDGDTSQIDVPIAEIADLVPAGHGSQFVRFRTKSGVRFAFQFWPGDEKKILEAIASQMSGPAGHDPDPHADGR